MATFQVVVDLGSFRVYSQTTVLQKGKSLTIGAGSLTLTGAGVELLWSQIVGRGAYLLGGQDVQFIAPGAVTYGTIVDGVLVAISTGGLPPSTDAILYFNLAGYSPLPTVGDYFSEICQEFTALPPAVPPGAIAPPFTPGGLPPVIENGGGNPGDVEEPGPVPLAFLIPVLIAFNATGPITEPAP